MKESLSEQELLDRLAALPREIAPERNLLADIHAAIDREQVRPIESWRSRSVWSLRLPLAAAAILLIVATAVVTRAIDDNRPPAAVASQAPQTGAQLVSHEVQALEQKYLAAITELQTLIDAQQSALSPRTREILRRNLDVIDAAIRDSRAALQEEPANEMINQMLWSAYEQKLELLRRATTVTST